MEWLFMCKRLFKAFVWLDFIIRWKELPNKIELTDDRRYVIITLYCGFKGKYAFYAISLGQYELMANL
ncbi:MAG: hypothetical protein BGO42_08080 [Flavobacterium sp. 40-81]|nr:MAG: hypothetical protein BGO42_08080 [Flavobacterium sp. 40-81]